tara:strand:+ start:1118 stop:1291 length:174 start_codon:yes stop_codon:yes gene_type:complete
MKDAERELFDEMIRHNIKSFTESDEHARDYHREMYTVIKHVLWDFQEKEKERDDENS